MCVECYFVGLLTNAYQLGDLIMSVRLDFYTHDFGLDFSCSLAYIYQTNSACAFKVIIVGQGRPTIKLEGGNCS